VLVAMICDVLNLVVVYVMIYIMVLIWKLHNISTPFSLRSSPFARRAASGHAAIENLPHMRRRCWRLQQRSPGRCRVVPRATPAGRVPGRLVAAGPSHGRPHAARSVEFDPSVSGGVRVSVTCMHTPTILLPDNGQGPRRRGPGARSVATGSGLGRGRVIGCTILHYMQWCSAIRHIVFSKMII
jgi:hypothetical protein